MLDNDDHAANHGSANHHLDVDINDGDAPAVVDNDDPTRLSDDERFGVSAIEQ